MVASSSFLPWSGYTLVGTTEDLYAGNPDELAVKRARGAVPPRQLQPLPSRTPLEQKDIVSTFAGLRWLAIEDGASLSATSRAYVIGERASKRGLLMTLYGGKLTTYRNLARTIGDRITKHFGEFKPSTTDQAASWANAAETGVDAPDIRTRFTAHGG